MSTQMTIEKDKFCKMTITIAKENILLDFEDYEDLIGEERVAYVVDKIAFEPTSNQHSRAFYSEEKEKMLIPVNENRISINIKSQYDKVSGIIEEFRELNSNFSPDLEGEKPWGVPPTKIEAIKLATTENC